MSEAISKSKEHRARSSEHRHRAQGFFRFPSLEGPGVGLRGHRAQALPAEALMTSRGLSK